MIESKASVSAVKQTTGHPARVQVIRHWKLKVSCGEHISVVYVSWLTSNIVSPKFVTKRTENAWPYVECGVLLWSETGWGYNIFWTPFIDLVDEKHKTPILFFSVRCLESCITNHTFVKSNMQYYQIKFQMEGVPVGLIWMWSCLSVDGVALVLGKCVAMNLIGFYLKSNKTETRPSYMFDLCGDGVTVLELHELYIKLWLFRR